MSILQETYYRLMAKYAQNGPATVRVPSFAVEPKSQEFPIESVRLAPDMPLNPDGELGPSFDDDDTLPETLSPESLAPAEWKTTLINVLQTCVRNSMMEPDYAQTLIYKIKRMGTEDQAKSLKKSLIKMLSEALIMAEEYKKNVKDALLTLDK